VQNNTQTRKPCSALVTGSQRGIVLLLVLWILSVLMVIAMSFSFITRTDAYSALAFKEGVENKFLAEAGIERGIMELVYRSVNGGQAITLEGMEVLKTDGRAYNGKLGNGSYRYRVTDESGKININALTDASGIVMKNLLIHSGVSTENADVIVDSILDWKDADDLHRLNGAESDYYLSLPNPYRAKDAPFDTLEELLLVRGVTPEILFGSDRKKGILRFLTVAPVVSSVINVNVAPREVLMAIPGMTADLADLVISDRESDDPSALQKVMDDIQIGLGPNYAPISQFIGTGDSNTFSIEATGFKDSEKKGYLIRAVVTFEGRQRYRYLYYKSPVEREG
jgi:general secretion pathway protein K